MDFSQYKNDEIYQLANSVVDAVDSGREITPYQEAILDEYERRSGQAQQQQPVAPGYPSSQAEGNQPPVLDTSYTSHNIGDVPGTPYPVLGGVKSPISAADIAGMAMGAGGAYGGAKLASKAIQMGMKGGATLESILGLGGEALGDFAGQTLGGTRGAEAFGNVVAGTAGSAVGAGLLRKGADALDTALDKAGYGVRPDELYKTARESKFGQEVGLGTLLEPSGLKEKPRYNFYGPDANNLQNKLQATRTYGDSAMEPTVAAARYDEMMDRYNAGIEKQLGDRYVRASAKPNAGEYIQNVVADSEAKIHQMADELYDIKEVRHLFNDTPEFRLRMIPELQARLEDVIGRYGLSRANFSKPLEGPVHGILKQLDDALQHYGTKHKMPGGLKAGDLDTEWLGDAPVDLHGFRRQVGNQIAKFKAKAAKGEAIDMESYAVLSDLYHEVLMPGLEGALPPDVAKKWGEFREFYKEYAEHRTNFLKTIKGNETGKTTFGKVLKDPNALRSYQYFHGKLHGESADHFEDIRKAIFLDALKVSDSAKKEAPTMDKFRATLEKTVAGMDKEVKEMLVHNQAWRGQKQQMEDILAVGEVLKRWADKNFSDIIQDGLRAAVRGDFKDSTLVSKEFVESARKYLPKMSDVDKESYQRLMTSLDKFALIGGHVGGDVSAGRFDLNPPQMQERMPLNSVLNRPDGQPRTMRGY